MAHVTLAYGMLWQAGQTSLWKGMTTPLFSMSTSSSCTNFCYGSGLIWLSWIRIRTVNADPDPRAPEFQPLKAFVRTCVGMFYGLLPTKSRYIFSCKNSTFLTARSDQDPDPVPHWFGSPWIRIRKRTEMKKAGSRSARKPMRIHNTGNKRYSSKKDCPG